MGTTPRVKNQGDVHVDASEHAIKDLDTRNEMLFFQFMGIFAATSFFLFQKRELKRFYEQHEINKKAQKASRAHE